MTPIDIAIVGCGTSGLATACFLADAGHRVTVFERFEVPRPVGAGLLLQPTGLASLARLGLDDAVIAQGARIDAIHGRTTGGAVVLDLAYARLGADVFGLGIHRGALFQVLFDALDARPVAITTGTEIARVREDGSTVWLGDASGSSFGPFDLAIDASGMRSVLRAGHASIRLDRPYPYGAVWGVCTLDDTWPAGNRLEQRYEGCHVMAGVLPIGRPSNEASRLAAVFWSLRGEELAGFRARPVAAWHDSVAARWPQARPLVEQFAGHDDLIFAGYGDVVLKRPFEGHVAFLGDAAHATSPQLGQGANLGLVDAMVFADCMAQSSQLDEALAAYARTRHAQVHFYQFASRALTPFFQSRSRLAALVRDHAFARLGRLPLFRTEMVRILAGLKTGVFTHLPAGRRLIRGRTGAQQLRTPPAGQ